MDLVVDILLDAVKDTLLIVPFLLVTYLVLEWLEHRAGEATQRAVLHAGSFGPIVGAVLGVVPQCGFSAAASTFFAGRVITVGTLIAVFLSTSDEMLPIFLAEAVPLPTIVAILAAKVAIAVVAGFLVDGANRLRYRLSGTDRRRDLRIHDLCEDANCYCEERCAGEEPGTHAHVPHDHDHCGHEHGVGSVVMSAIKHTAQITLFVFIVNLVLGAVLETVGEDVLGAVLGQSPVLAILISAVVGLIPNCAASVAIATLYVEGVLGSGAMLAGLLSSAGVGLLVLCRTNRDARTNVLIIVALWAIAVVCGLIVFALGIVF